MSTTRRIITACLAAAAAAVPATLAGCDTDQIGAAAVVDGDRFTVDDLQKQVEEVEGLDGFDVEAAGGMSTFQRELLTRHIQHEIFRRLAEDEDIDVSDADIDNAIEEIESQVPDGDMTPLLAQNGFTVDAFRAGVTDQLIAEAYVQDAGGDQNALLSALTDLGDRIGVEVNPRYGTWGEELSVTPESGSISEAVDGDPAEAPPPGSDQ